jgi:hypothetical protein
MWLTSIEIAPEKGRDIMWYTPIEIAPEKGRDIMWYKPIAIDAWTKTFKSVAADGNQDSLEQQYSAAGEAKKTLEQACLVAAANGCTDNGSFVRAQCCFNAAQGGNLPTLQCAVGGAWPYHESEGHTRAQCLKIAKAHGHREIEEWIIGPGSPRIEEVD